MKSLADTLSGLTPHLNVLFLLGLALFGGTVGGRVFQKLRIPRVVGYIVVGVVLGKTALNVIDEHTLQALRPFSYFALGIIGFMIGGELKKSVFKKHGKEFLYILLGEGLLSFALVTVLTVAVGSLFIRDARLLWSVGLLLGAISSATAPAGTTDVLWEYRTKGPVTQTLLAIVALDDSLSLLLFAFAASVANVLLGLEGAQSFLALLERPVYEIAGSIVVGGASGMLLAKLFRRQVDRERGLVFSIGTVLLVIGVARVLEVDLILASMALGVAVANYSPRKSKELFELVEGFSPPIYVLFFVLFGASLNISRLPLFGIALALAYIVGRTAGKMLGAALGARIARAPDVVRRYLPPCLFSQAGVAIGLSILVAQKFQSDIGNLVAVVITTTTFIVQLIGPPAIKWAVTRAGEVGLNITEEDLIKKYKVADVMDTKIPRIYEETPLSKVLQIFSENDYLHYPVVNDDGKLVGVLTIEHLKDSFTALGLQEFLLAHDIMDAPVAVVTPQTDMPSATELMRKYDVSYLPVVNGEGRLAGFIEARSVRKLVSQRLAQMQQKVQFA